MTVEVSTDLVSGSWAPVHTNTTLMDPIEFRETNSLQHPARMYRARIPTP